MVMIFTHYFVLLMMICAHYLVLMVMICTHCCFINFYFISSNISHNLDRHSYLDKLGGYMYSLFCFASDTGDNVYSLFSIVI